MPPRLLVADDDQALLELMSMTLRKEGCHVLTASSAAQVRERLDQARFDLVVCDIYLGDATAIDLLAEIGRAQPQAAIILVTAQGTVETAAAAAAAGVLDYLAKPFELEQLVGRVKAALRPTEQPATEVAAGPESMIVGSHPRIVAVYTAVARVARLPVPVLITGETGTGKELVARALHRFGARPDGPFVAINCGAIPEGLLESEVFGHRRGAYTGADRDHAGAIVSARGGTVFLDEVGDLPRQLQVKLLRFLADGEVRPLGSDATITVDSRVVAATNRNLQRDVAAGRFRDDLYYRLAGYTIELPPLPERASDIPALVEHFRRRTAVRLGLDELGAPSQGTLAVLTAYRWPGNVRELENVIQRAAVDFGSLRDAAAVARLLPAAERSAAPSQPAIGDDFTLEEIERLHIAAVLARCEGNRTRTAQILGIERKSLYRKARRLGIELDPKAGED
jgi:DNA-binding NtrC family response regulator